MNYIVLDLEWNQAMSASSPVYNRLPIHLRGEIIQIGAVRLTEDMQPGEEFQMDVRPVFFRKIHYKVKKITGFDKERLENGETFKDAFEKFRAWCGDDATFLTWGYDDQGIMEQNIIIHDLDWDWIAGWINLQVIFNIQLGGDRNQKALQTAMEHYGIEQTRVAHDALGDAYNTALVCSHLDIDAGMEQYEEYRRHLPTKQPKGEGAQAEGPEPIEHTVSEEYADRETAWEDESLICFSCPDCGKKLSCSRWVNQGDRRYMSMAECPDHGRFLIRLRFRKTDTSSWVVNRLVYTADETMDAYYKAKIKQPSKRRRRRKKPLNNK